MWLLLLTASEASDWPTARGPAEGTQAHPGAGDITGVDGGYPTYAWVSDYSTTTYNTGWSAVIDADGDGLPETLGVTRSRVYLWDQDGTVLGATESMSSPYIHGIYDLDGDGRTNEVVVIGTGVGGGVFIYDASSLALLYRSEDPGLNGGGSVAETAVIDTDGDGIPELLWTTSFTGYADYRLISFLFGFGAPVEVALSLPTTSTGLLPAVAGDYAGVPGGFLVEQGTVVSWFESTDRLSTGAVCSDDETRCLRVVGQFTGVHASGTSGDRLSFDADGDGDDEYLTASFNDLGAVDLGVMDPTLYGTSTNGLLWQYRYGNGAGVPLNRFVYAPEGQGFSSSSGGSVVVATVSGSESDETDAAGNAADDCVDAAGRDATIAFDAVTGDPLASILDARAYGVMDGDGDGVPEIVAESSDGITGYELVCTGAWNSCSDTGCTLDAAWSVDGELPTVLNQQIPATSYRAEVDVEPAILDLDGDGLDDLVVEDGSQLAAWSFAGGTATELGRYTLGSCSSLGGWGDSASGGTWFVLEGTGCHVVLDETLGVVTSPALQDYVQGVGLAMVGEVGDGPPVLAIGSRIFTDPSSAGGMAAPDEQLSDTPVRFADLDGDGVDELITYRQASNGDWSVALYRWTGLLYSEDWRVQSTTLGGTDRNINVTYAPYDFTTGDFDGDGDDDIAFFTSDYTRGATAFSDKGTLFVVDGVTGESIASLVAPPIGTSATYSEPMQALDLCAGTTCPGTDGVDEIVLSGGSSVTVYGAGVGYIYGFSLDTTAEVMIADFDGDGGPELGLGAGFTATGSFYAAVTELDGTLVWSVEPGSAAGSPYAMHAAADVDEDGAADLLVGGGYGELTAYSGRDGSVIAGFPIYLREGAASTALVSPTRRVLQLAMVDVDGDSHVEALVAHDDGYLYAVNVAPSEGAGLAWSAYLASPVYSVRPIDADADGSLEVLVLANEGSARLIDGGDVVVEVVDPEDEACVGDATYELSGTAEGVDEVEIYVQGVSEGRYPVDDGEWTFEYTWPSEGTFRIEVWAVLEDFLVASDTVSVTYYDDADGDGVSECDDDCDDANPDRFPGAEEECDGIDADCDGALSDESDDDGDGYLACEECDDASADVRPDGEELCDGLDNDCDDEIDEDGACPELTSYWKGGGGCDCATGDGRGVALAGVLLAMVAARRR